MKQKVILISIDGMRPDGLLQCNNAFVQADTKCGWKIRNVLWLGTNS